MEESFPRGGNQKNHEQATVTKRPKENDNLFSTYHEEENEIKKKKKKLTEKPQTVRHVKSTAGIAKDQSADILKYKNLSVGVLLLGCVKEARDFELVVRLPHGLTGYVHATHVCEAYTKLLSEQVEKEEPLKNLSPLSSLFSPGMLVRCAVISLESTAGGFHSIKLSVDPKVVNTALASGSLRKGMLLSGCVSSLEDHGYLIDIGIGGTKAFLPLQKAQIYLSHAGKGATLRIGQYLNCVIEEVKNDGRIVRLSITQSDVAAAFATKEQNWTLNNLLPGLVVRAQIQKVDVDSISLSFLSSYTGIVDFLHFDPKKSDVYKEDQDVKACILWVDPSSKSIRLTLRQSFLQPGTQLHQLTSDRLGSVLQNCTVKALHKHAGAVFQLDEATLGFAFKHQLSESKQPFNPQAFKAGSTHTGRITEFSPMDEILLLSLKESVVEGPYLRHDDLQAGQLVEGTVSSLEAIGMVMNITNHLTGLVPRLHLADVLLHHPEKKYKIGDKLRCRVLTVNPEARKLILTRKKTLINSKLPVISSYQDAKPGLVTHGFIASIKDYGCIIKFYNEVYGLAPRRELSSQPIPFLNEMFYEGQVIKVRVLGCEPEKEKILLSFKITKGQDIESEKHHLKKTKPMIHETGEFVDVRVVNKTDEGLTVSILPEGSPAFLPKMQLSDYVTNCELLYHWLKEGDALSGAMCLSSFRGQLILTKKASLITSVEKELCVKVISEVQVGMLVTGFVKNIMPYGAFVELPYGLVGLVPKGEISDKFVSNISEHVVQGQTVVAKVTNVDEEKKRFLLTLKLSECSPDDCSAESFARLSQCFSELQLLKSLINKQEDEGENISSLVPGKKFSVVVEAVHEDGSVNFSISQIGGAQTLSATPHHVAGKDLVAGQKVKAVVLHVDVLKSHIHVSLDEKLLSKRKETFKEDSSYSAVVQHVSEEFAIVSLESTSQLAAVPVTSHFNDTFHFESEKLSIRQEISLTLKTNNSEDFGVLLAVQNDGKAKKKVEQKRPSSVVTSKCMKNGLRVGQVVTGTVKSIKPTCVMVSIGDDVVGFIHVSHILEDVPLGSFPTSKLRPKQSVTCRVIGGKDLKTHRFLPITHPNFTQSVPELSILPSQMNTQERVSPPADLKTYTAGQKITCYVLKYNTEKKYLELEIKPEIRGRVELLLLSLSPKMLKRPEKRFKPGQALSAVVIGQDTCHRCLSLSLIDTYELVEGSVMLSCVKSVNPGTGLTVSLPLGKTGNVNLFHLNDCFAEASLENFSPGKIVRCCILSVSKTIEVSLRQSRTNPNINSKTVDSEITSIETLEIGQLVNGFVCSVIDKGIFFRLSGSVVGHIQFNKVTGYYVPDLPVYKKYIPEGTLLTAKVLNVHINEGHVELSLLSADTGKPDVIPPEAKLELKRKKDGKTQKMKKRKRTDSEIECQKTIRKKKKFQTSKEDDDSGVEVYSREEAEKRKKHQKEKMSVKAPVSRLQVSAGFSWDVSLNTLQTALAHEKEDSSDSDEEEEDQQPKPKKTKKEKEIEKKKEQEISKIEATFLDPNWKPQSANDFDRLVLGSPNSSILWLQYMAFHLHATEIEKARAIAERALKTISFREEQEKLNVWVAFLNLENMYGTEETLLKTFERAVQYNEPIKVFHQLADIYNKSEKFKQADDLYNTMLKRFRQEKSVWLKYATFLLKQGQPEATHRLLQRALRCLPDKEHVDVISKFAQLEFHLGDTEHAKALFESTLSNYPKRTDLWSVYIDMMMKHGSQKEVRDIFERVIHLSLAAKRIKFFFKRYLEYEKKHGSAESVHAVKEKALEYVESKISLTKAQP